MVGSRTRVKGQWESRGGGGLLGGGGLGDGGGQGWWGYRSGGSIGVVGSRGKRVVGV